MLETTSLQAAALGAAVEITTPNAELWQRWQSTMDTAIAMLDEEAEPTCAPASAAQDHTTPTPPDEPPAPLTAPVDATATSLTVQRQLVQATAPETADTSWQLSLPTWDVHATRASTAPLWTLTLTPLQPSALTPDPAALAANLQARLTRLPSPLNARVVLASEERSPVAERREPHGPHGARPW